MKISPFTGDWVMSGDSDDDDQGLNLEDRHTFEGLEDGDCDGLEDGDITIYPHPDGEPEVYKYDHLVQFTMKAIQKYNQDMGKQYQFLQLEEACIFSLYEIDTIKVFFQASSHDDGIILNFKAMIDCPSDDATFLSSPPDLQPIWVVPSLPYDPQSLPNSDSPPALNLEAQIQQLQV